MDAIGIEIDPVVVEERELLPDGRHAEQPERNRDAHELSRVRVVGQHAQRVELAVAALAPGSRLAMQDRFVVFPDLDERLLSGEPRARLRELLRRRSRSA